MRQAEQFAIEDADYIIKLRRYIHQHPELSFKEVKTTELIAKELEECGIEVITWSGKTGVLGILKGAHPGKTLALRSDIDALPLTEQSGLDFHSLNDGVAHCCGHDIHMSVLLGTARVLSKMKDHIHGTVKFFFQPAEEFLGGSKDFVARGVMENPKVDAIFALHCWPDIPEGTIGVRAGSFMASSDSVDIKIIGKAGHAAHPHRSIDPIVAAAAVVQGIQTIVSRETAPIDPTVISFGSIHGGTARNIIAANVELQGTVRTASNSVREHIPEMLERIANNIASAYRCRAEVDFQKGIPAVINNETLTARVACVGSEVLGKDKVIQLSAISMGSEDFSVYMQQAPGCVFRLGTGTDEAQSHLALHNPEIRFGEKALLTGVNVVSSLALDYLKK